MKLFAVSALATLVASVAASQANHVDLVKRAYITNIAVETVTVTEESYLFAYSGSDAVNVINDLQLALSGMVGSATDPSALKCDDSACPLTSIIGDLLVEILPRNLPSITISTALPGKVKVLNLDAIADSESVPSVTGVPVRTIDAARLVSEAFGKLSPIQSMNINSAFSQPEEIINAVADAIRGVNSGVVDFASIAGQIIDDAQGAVGGLLSDLLS